MGSTAKRARRPCLHKVESVDAIGDHKQAAHSLSLAAAHHNPLHYWCVQIRSKVSLEGLEQDDELAPLNTHVNLARQNTLDS